MYIDLKEINFSNFKIYNVTNMNSRFYKLP